MMKIQNCTAQRDSGIYSLGMGVMGVMGIMRERHIIENSPLQRDSKMSNGRLSGVSCWPHGRKTENAPARWDSGISKLRVLGILRSLGILGEQPVMQISPDQRDSEISILKNRPLCPYCPCCPLDFKNGPAQRDSKMSNGRLSGVSCWPHWQNRLPQRDSGNSILGVGSLETLRSLGILGGKTKSKSSSAQRDSEISNLKVETGNSLPQRDSGNSILKTCPYRPLAVRLVQLGIIP
jgi:hypothetical protein